MSPEAQRIAIALSMGYTECTDEKCDYRKAQHLHHPRGAVFFPDPYSTVRYPDYLNDLNAMAEAEQALNHDHLRHYRLTVLPRVCCKNPPGESIEGAVTATAAQRAEAYLRTIGKWVEEAPASTNQIVDKLV